MSQSPNRAASEVYEIVTQSPAGPKSWFRVAFLFLVNLIAVGAGPHNPGGMILSVREKGSGIEVFRHVEDMGDDEGRLLHGIQQDLERMTAAEFTARWVD